MWIRKKIQNVSKDSMGEASPETSDRIDADCASVMSFNHNDFDEETASRFAKRASTREHRPELSEFIHSANNCMKCLSKFGIFLRTHGTAFAAASFIFIILCCGSIALGEIHFKRSEKNSHEHAKLLASETLHFLSERMEKAMIPMLSMMQLVYEMPAFVNLTHAIGGPNEKGSLPYDSTRPKFRDLNGSVCQDPEMKALYLSVAERIDNSFGELKHHHHPQSRQQKSEEEEHEHGHGHSHSHDDDEDIPRPWITLALAPHGVVCLSYPEIDSTEYRSPHPLSADEHMGFDFAASPTKDEVSRYIGSGKIPLFGLYNYTIPCPIGEDHGHSSQECENEGSLTHVFEARMPIQMGGTSMQFRMDDGSTYTYPFWGMIVMHINWDTLLSASGFVRRFKDENMEFILERFANDGTVTTIASSEFYHTAANNPHNCGDTQNWTSELHGETWQLSLSHEVPTTGKRGWMFPVLILVSLSISLLLFKILLQKQEYLIIRGVAMAQDSKVETERNMTAYFAHELRNPLSAMDSALKALTDDEMSPSAKELIDGMRICASFMASIMNNLLDVRKMEEGQLTLKRMPLNMDELVENVHRMFLPNVRSGVKFSWRSDFLSKDQRWVIGDSHRLQQIFTNVITNALKYTTSGSVVLSIGWEHDRPRSFTERNESCTSSSIDVATDVSTQPTSGPISCPDPSVLLQQGKSSEEESTENLEDSFCVKGAPSVTPTREPLKDSSTRTGILKESSIPQDNFMDTSSRRSSLKDTSSRESNFQDTSSRHQSSLKDTSGRRSSLKNTSSRQDNLLESVDSGLMESHHRGPPRLRFECADTGPGILKSHQADLFKKFVQRGGAPGTGLGLAISKHLVDLMGGEIYYDSDPTIKPGSSCIVLLPLPLCDAPPSDDEKSKGGIDSLTGEIDQAIEEPLSILIVDDIKLNRMMLRRRFEKSIARNCQISEAPNGETAVDLCTSQTFDVIIMDQFMEDGGGLLTGTDTILALRRQGVTAIIIGCSGNDLDADFMEAGADYCWHKPLPPNGMIIRQLREHHWRKRK